VTDAYKNLLKAAKLVMILNDAPRCQVPGFPVKLDPKAAAQIQAAIIWAEAEVEMPQGAK